MAEMPKILVTGASGRTGGAVLSALAGSGAWVRGLVRTPAQAESVRAGGAAEVAVGDLTDMPSIEVALAGMNGLFYVPPAFLPREAEVGQRVIAAAKNAGLRRIVFSSVIHPVISHLANHAAKAPVEEAILDSGLKYSLLHPALFYQNLDASWDRIVQTGVLAEPWSADTRFSRVDYRDVAETAAIALTSDRLLYGTFELCSDGHSDRHDMARLIGAALGRDIKVGRIDPTKLPPAQAPLKPMFEHYDHSGLLGNALTLRAILGREPRTLKAYIAELASKGQRGKE